jgi:hypothetical protein
MSALQPFVIGVREDPNNTVLRTSTESTSIDNSTNVQTYTATLNLQRNEEVFLPLTTSINKADKKTYAWITASGEGSVIKAEGRKVAGIGVVDYIRHIGN